MIRQVSFRNFKILRHVSTTLEQFTVIVGPNSSGKSSILQGLNLLCEAGRRKTRPQGMILPNSSEFWSRGAKDDLEIECTEDHGCFRLRASAHRSSGNPKPGRFTMTWKEAPKMAGWQSVPQGQLPPASSLLRLEAANLAKPSYTENATPKLGPTGEGLHSALAYLALNQPDAFQELQSTFTRIIPAVRRIRFARTGVEQVKMVDVSTQDRNEVRYERRAYMTELLLLDTAGASGIPAPLASEGTLLVLGVLTVLFSQPRPQLLLLDDLDRGLHPKAQLEMVAFLRTLLETQPDLQLVATTHSPYILDKLRPEEVRLTTLLDDGWTACARMQDHPQFEKWKEEMTPGEFWSLIGEKWVGEQVAAGVG